mmetsp:Transcript_38420/g.61667  ORF Transcript_38420/g.61667 Transcript_38420/m.61667 type:complete len:414 (-) Transcript_38420:159-1400(-)
MLFRWLVLSPLLLLCTCVPVNFGVLSPKRTAPNRGGAAAQTRLLHRRISLLNGAPTSCRREAGNHWIIGNRPSIRMFSSEKAPESPDTKRRYSHSEEMRRRISERTREALARPEVKNKMRSKSTGAISADTRKKIGESVAKAYANMPAEKKQKSEAHRRKIAESIRKKWADENYRRKATSGMSKAMKEKWEDPKYREAKSSSTVVDISSAGGGRKRAGGAKKKVKPAAITKEAEAIISSAQKLQDTRTKVIRIANAVEQLAKQAKTESTEKAISQARTNLDALRSGIDKQSEKLKDSLRSYLDIRTGKLSRRSLMTDVFEQFNLKHVYDEALEELAPTKKKTDEGVKKQSAPSPSSSSPPTAATDGNEAAPKEGGGEGSEEESDKMTSKDEGLAPNGEGLWNLDLGAMTLEES